MAAFVILRFKVCVKTRMLLKLRRRRLWRRSEAKKAEDLVLHGITITHPGRVISDTGHITKGELAEYYAAVAPLDVATDRAASVESAALPVRSR